MMMMIGQTVYHYSIARSAFRCPRNSRISSHPTLRHHNENSHYIQRNKPADTTVRNLPNFHNTILRPTSYNIVIMWTPSYIQYRTFVPTNQRVVCSNSSYLWKQSNNSNKNKGTSTSIGLKVPSKFAHSIN